MGQRERVEMIFRDILRVNLIRKKLKTIKNTRPPFITWGNFNEHLPLVLSPFWRVCDDIRFNNITWIILSTESPPFITIPVIINLFLFYLSTRVSAIFFLLSISPPSNNASNPRWLCSIDTLQLLYVKKNSFGWKKKEATKTAARGSKWGEWITIKLRMSLGI